jgi:hypothetical protein
MDRSDWDRPQTSKWDSSFSRRQPTLNYAVENKQYFHRKHEKRRHVPFIDICVENPSAPQRFRYRADQLKDFCRGLDYEVLETSTGKLLNHPNSLVDDRREDLIAGINHDGIKRKTKGPLSPQQLYQELGKPVRGNL